MCELKNILVQYQLSNAWKAPPIPFCNEKTAAIYKAFSIWSSSYSCVIKTPLFGDQHACSELDQEEEVVETQTSAKIRRLTSYRRAHQVIR